MNQSKMRYLLPFIIAPLFFACSKNTQRMLTSKSLEKVGITSDILKKNDFAVGNIPSNENISITYLGSGGCFIENETDGILIDPFFSHHSFWSLPIKKIKTNSEDVSLGLETIKKDLIKVKGIFVSHSHYDHLMDVPFIYHHYLDTVHSNIKIYGSQSMSTILSTVIEAPYLFEMESYTSSVDDIGKWIKIADSNIRVLPVKTEHAPHYKKGIPVRMYKGQAERIKTYDSDTAKTKANQWKGGKTFAFLIDFMKNGSISSRIYVQSSSAAPPNGFVHQKILEEHPIDLAVLGTASFSNVNNYPKGIVNHLQPKRIMLCHWEDFFIPYEQSPERLVRATNIRKFILKLNESYPWIKDGEERFFMPQPGVRIELNN